MDEKINIVIITGFSGAGKTKAIGILEDLGYFCVDNLPPNLIEDFIELVTKTGGRINKIGIVLDIRSREFLEDIPPMIDKLRRDKRFSVKVIFLEANTETLVKRFSETRRKHPVEEGISLQEKIEIESNLLAEIRSSADFIIDTTNFALKDLKARIMSIVLGSTTGNLEILVESFGYKYGLPLQADIVMDVRFIPNPFYVKGLGEETGKSESIKKYVLSFEETRIFLNKFESLLLFLIPKYINEGKSYLTIALGCTGGKHRSVAIGEILADFLKNKGYSVKIQHRDIDK